jgi:succinate dehydrogenase / fumarate reductase iron-sulfur subunit
MVINGRVRQACSALVDQLLDDNPEEIELRPMSKFPVVRDLMVERSRLFQGLQRVKAWVAVDSYMDLGPGPRRPRQQQEEAYPLSKCMSCGCCLEACPQFTKIEVPRMEGESEVQHMARRAKAYAHAFLGAHAISQAMLFNSHPSGTMEAADRLEALAAPGGIQDCGNAQNCVIVCPKEIPLTTSIARAGRATTLHSFKKWFDH